MPNVTFLEPGTDATQDALLFNSYGFLVSGGGNSTMASDTTHAHTGGRAIKCEIINSNGGYICECGGDDSVVAGAGCASAWYYFETLPPSTHETNLGSLYGNGFSGSYLSFGINSAGNLVVRGLNGGSKVGTTVLTVNGWYRISLSFNIPGPLSSSPYSWKLYLNGSLELTGTEADGVLASGGSPQMVSFGTDVDGNQFTDSWAIRYWMDDLYVDDRSDLTDCGDIRVTCKRPFSNGSLNEFSTSGAGSGYGSGHAPYVNERPESASSWVEIVGVGSIKTEEFNGEGLSAGDVDLTGATIKGVRGWAYLAATLSETAKIVVDGTQTNVALGATTQTIFKNSNTPTVFPAGSGADIGIITDTTLCTIALYECGILVAYTPAAGGATKVPYQSPYSVLLSQ